MSTTFHGHITPNFTVLCPWVVLIVCAIRFAITMRLTCLFGDWFKMLHITSWTIFTIWNLPTSSGRFSISWHNFFVIIIWISVVICFQFCFWRSKWDVTGFTGFVIVKAIAFVFLVTLSFAIIDWNSIQMYVIVSGYSSIWSMLIFKMSRSRLSRLGKRSKVIWDFDPSVILDLDGRGVVKQSKDSN